MPGELQELNNHLLGYVLSATSQKRTYLLKGFVATIEALGGLM